MLYYLQDCSKSTPIGQLPGIINHNNEAIANLFNWIYDSSLNRLTKSVYAPTGSITAHFGEFVNLSVEYITIKHVDSLKNSILKAVDEIISSDIDEHNILRGRFSSDAVEQMVSEHNSNYCHDADIIVTADHKTVLDKIDAFSEKDAELDGELELIRHKDAELDASIIKLFSAIDTLDASMNEHFVDLSTKLNDKFVDISNNIAELQTKIEEDIDTKLEEMDQKFVEVDNAIEETKEQCTYIAGQNIDITDNVVSALGYELYNTSNGEEFSIMDDAIVVDASRNIAIEQDMIFNGRLADSSIFTAYGMIDAINLLVNQVKTLSELLKDANEKIEDLYARLDGVAVLANKMLTYQTGDNTELTEVDYEDATIRQATDLADEIAG